MIYMILEPPGNRCDIAIPWVSSMMRMAIIATILDKRFDVLRRRHRHKEVFGGHRFRIGLVDAEKLHDDKCCDEDKEAVSEYLFTHGMEGCVGQI